MKVYKYKMAGGLKGRGSVAESKIYLKVYKYLGIKEQG